MGSINRMNDKQTSVSFIDKISKSLEGWVKIPAYDDPGLQRKSEILHTLTFLSLMLGFAVLTITPFIFIDQVQGVSITMGVMVILFLIQTLNRKGLTTAAAYIFVVAILIFDFGMVLFSGGFQSQFLAAFISITIMGGLILGEMYAYYIAGTSIIAFLTLFFIDLQGLTPTPLIIFTPIAVILINVINLFLAATVLIMVLTKYEENFRALIDKEQTLERTNYDLKQEVEAREQADSLLQQSENRLKSALMESPFPTMLHAQDGEILLVNTAWIQKTGYSPEDLPNFQDWLEHLFREKSSEVDRMIGQLLSGDDSEKENFFNLTKNNGDPLKWYLRWTKLPALPDGRVLFLAIGTDLTSLTDIESTLREREETLSIFTLITNDGIWDWNLTTDKVIYDPRYYTMSGYEVNEFPHELEEFRKRIHPDDVERVFSEAEKHLKGEIDRFRVEFRFQQADGSWQWIMGRGKITEQDEYGNPLRFVGTHTDINAQKSIEEKLSEYQIQLEDIVEDRTQKLNDRVTEVERLNAALTNILDDYQAANERLSILGDNLSAANQELESMTYSLSTVLLNPIQTIENTAKTLANKKPKGINKKDLELLQGISTSAELVQRQIEDLLRISQLSQKSLQVETIDFEKLVRKVFKTYADEIKERQIKTTIKDLPPCRGDRDLLEMVMENLISNSIKFTTTKEEPEIQVGYQPDADSDRVVYYIRDNGVGFDPEDRELVFGVFQQLEIQESQPGRGIGLTLTKLIINKHNGRIWTEAEKGEGATFYFDLASPEIDG